VWGLLTIVGRFLLLGIVFLLPLFLLAWFQSKIRSRWLLWIASLGAIGSAFFLFAFFGYSLDPKYRDVPLAQRLGLSLLIAAVVTLAIAVIQPVLHRLVPSLFRPSPFRSSMMRRLRQRHPEEFAKWEEKLGASLDEEGD